MSDYRRFVSYIYEYSHGRKSRNTGFAKVESRGGVLKLQIQMQGVSSEEGVLEIYTFVREGGWLEGILLGKARTHTSATEIRLMTPADHVGNVDYSLDQLSGLWISSERGGTYLSLWDEEPVDLSKLRPLVTEGKGGEQEPSAEPADVTEQKETGESWNRAMQGDADAERKAGEAAEPEEPKASEAAELEEPKASEAEEPEGAKASEASEPEGAKASEAAEPEGSKASEASESEGLKASETGESEGPEAQEDRRSEEADAEDTCESPRKEQEQVQQAEAQPEEGKLQEAAQEQVRAEEKEGQEASDVKAAQTACAAKASPGSRPCAGCQKYQSALDQRWRQLSGARAHVQPFADDQIDDCLQVSPRELGILYQSRYPVGRNSFLMHGYYNYRHLLFGRCKDGSYFLGVPGIFENQEKMMASMFGFPEFRRTREQNQTRGPFGYWCRRIG